MNHLVLQSLVSFQRPLWFTKLTTSSLTRTYVTRAPKQGTKRSPKKRTLLDMPGWKHKVKKEINALKEQETMRPLNLFDHASMAKYYKENLPAEAEPKGPYKNLFPGEDEIPKEGEVYMAELDREYEKLEKQAAIVLQLPDFMIYDSLVEYRLREAELEWTLNTAESPSRESNAKLQEKLDQIKFETEAEFDLYLDALPKMNKAQRRAARQQFLDQMEGRIHVFPHDVWKKQLLLPKYDLTLHPLTMRQQASLFWPGKVQLDREVATQKRLYKNYDKLALQVPTNFVGPADATDRILAHLEMRKNDERTKKMKEDDIAAEKLLDELEMADLDADDEEDLM